MSYDRFGSLASHLGSARNVVRFAAIVSALIMTACAGSGGSYSPPPSAPLPPAPPPTAIIGAPAPASFGTTPQPAQTATAGGPAFDGSGSLPSNVSFPVLATTMQFTTSGAPAVPGDQSSTVTIVASSATSTSFQLVIPSVNINVSYTFDRGVGDSAFSGLSYVTLGLWQAAVAGNLTSITALAFGYETPANAMPTTGTANYSGVGTVHGVVIYPLGVGEQPAAFAVPLTGDAHLSANFATGAVTGGFTKITAEGDYDYGASAWNDVSVNASIAAGTNKFSGSTAVTSPGSGIGSVSLKGSATGHIDGAFYGPSAQNLGAIWSLSDGTASAIGTVAAGR